MWKIRQSYDYEGLKQAMKAHGLWEDFMTDDKFMNWAGNGIIYELSDNRGKIGYFTLTNLVKHKQVQEDLYILPNRVRKWATKERLADLICLAKDMAFDVLGVQRLVGFVYSDNTPSIKLTEWLGFSREGTLRRFARINGEWKDVHIYSIVRTD